MPAYDASLFDPPEPLAKVTLRNRGDGTTLSDVPMLLDSGADVTLVPQASVRQLGMQVDPNEGYELMGFDGSRSMAQAVQLDLIFVRRTFRGRFLIISQEWGVLGRDVLNHLSLLLDGPHLSWNESPSGER